MKIEICIPVFNGQRYVKDTIISALSQTTTHQLSVRVIDDCSTDQSVAEIESLRSQCNFEFSRNTSNSGLMAVNKKFAETSSADALIYLGQDDILPSTHVQVAADELNRTGKSLIWFNGFTMDQDGLEIEPIFKSNFKQVLKSKFAKFFFTRSNFISSCGLILTRDSLMGAGNWPDDFANYGEWMLWLRIAKKNEIHYCSSSAPRYRLHDNNLSLELNNTNLNFLEYVKSCKTEALNVIFKKHS